MACVVSWKRSVCPSVKATGYSRSLSQVVGSDRMFSFGSFSLEENLQSVSAALDGTPYPGLYDASCGRALERQAVLTDQCR